MIRVALPAQLRKLAQVGTELDLAVDGAATQRSVLDALETSYPMLCGTIRDQVTQERRAFVRFFACGQYRSHELPDQSPAVRKEHVAEGTSFSSEPTLGV